MKQKERSVVYGSFEDDVIQSADQERKLPEDYQWIRSDPFFRVVELLLYPVAFVFGWIYCRFFLHISIKNRKVLRMGKGSGYFLYGNHTQPVGDVFIPAIACFPKHIYVIVSPANFGIPVIGGMLPMLGALPTASDAKGLRRMTEAISARCAQGKCVVVYPEAHVWPYCTFIRPYAATAFRYPVMENAPSFCMTTTYQKRRFGSKPKITVWIDGPFYSPEQGSPRQKRDALRDSIYHTMLSRSKSSTYAYIRYKEAHEL